MSDDDLQTPSCTEELTKSSKSREHSPFRALQSDNEEEDLDILEERSQAVMRQQQDELRDELEKAKSGESEHTRIS